MALNVFESMVFTACAVATTFNLTAIAHNLALISNQLHRHIPKIIEELAKSALKR